MVRNKSAWVVIIAAVTMAACTRLPNGFAALSPDDKVAAYVTYLRDGGAPKMQARHLIANDGARAADSIAQALNRSDNDIDKNELILILQDIHTAGTDLRGTPAELALRDIAASQPSTDTTQLADATLQIINQDRGSSARSTTQHLP